jgi:ABC-type Zn uptake system ZnuABC Zn-binding protein ZnuA
MHRLLSLLAFIPLILLLPACDPLEGQSAPKVYVSFDDIEAVWIPAQAGKVEVVFCEIEAVFIPAG